MGYDDYSKGHDNSVTLMDVDYFRAKSTVDNLTEIIQKMNEIYSDVKFTAIKSQMEDLRKTMVGFSSLTKELLKGYDAVARNEMEAATYLNSVPFKKWREKVHTEIPRNMEKLLRQADNTFVDYIIDAAKGVSSKILKDVIYKGTTQLTAGGEFFGDEVEKRLASYGGKKSRSEVEEEVRRIVNERAINLGRRYEKTGLSVNYRYHDRFHPSRVATLMDEIRGDRPTPVPPRKTASSFYFLNYRPGPSDSWYNNPNFNVVPAPPKAVNPPKNNGRKGMLDPVLANIFYSIPRNKKGELQSILPSYSDFKYTPVPKGYTVPKPVNPSTPPLDPILAKIYYSIPRDKKGNLEKILPSYSDFKYTPVPDGPKIGENSGKGDIFDKMGSFFDTIGKVFTPKQLGVMKAAMGVAKKIEEAIVGIIGGLAIAVKGVGNAGSAIVGFNLSNPTGSITSAISGIGGGAISGITGVGKVAGSIPIPGMKAVGAFIGLMGQTVGAGLKVSNSLLQSILKGVTQIMETTPLFKTIKDILNLSFTMFFLPAMTLLADKLMPIFTNLLEWAVDMGDTFSQVFAPAIDGIYGLFMGVADGIKAFFTGDNISKLADFLAQGIALFPQMLTMALGWIELFLNNKDAIFKLIQSMLDTFTRVMNQGNFSRLIEFGAKAMEFLANHADEILDTMIGIANVMMTLTGGIFGARDVAGKVVDAFLSAGRLGMVRLASGGYVPSTPGGIPAIIGEGGEGEYVIPESKLGGIGGTTIIFSGNVYGMNDFKQTVRQIVNETATRASYR